MVGKRTSTSDFRETDRNGVVEGTENNDLMTPGFRDADKDQIDGRSGADDRIFGFDGDDTILAGAGNDTVDGGADNDILAGGTGSNLLNGGEGDDRFIGGSGADTFQGGADQDNLDYSNSDSAVQVNLTDGSLSGGDADNDKIAGGIDGVIGTGFGDELIGFDHQGTHPDDVFTNEFFGEGGNDTIDGKAGDDQLYGGSGDDSIDGGDGDDLIKGDASFDDGSLPIRESFEWDLAPVHGGVDDGDPLSSFTQNTGSVDVTFTTVQQSAASETTFAANDQNISGLTGDGNPVDDNSSLSSILNGQGNSADYRLEFGDEVENVSFQINDVDGDGVARVQAFDADGNQIEVNLSGGSYLTLSDTDSVAGVDTVDSNGGYLPDTSPGFSVLIEIPGPVSRIEIAHDQDGRDNTGINITDVYFDAPATGDTGEDGDDTLNGGAGADTILGQGGDDVITGGAGADYIDGGAGRDLIIGGTDGDVVDGGSEGYDFDTLDLSGTGPFRVVNQSIDADGNSTNGTIEFLDAYGNVTGTLNFGEIELIVPCFTPGTLIATPNGERLVEDLQVGDRVITRDNGLQKIRWIGKRPLNRRELLQAPHLKPVRVRAGSLGAGLPERDMLLSPQHRILMNDDQAALYFGEREVLAAAKHLTGLKGVDVVDVNAATYIHFMFDQHEVVLSDGAWTESFQPGEGIMDGMNAQQRDEIYTLFPELQSAGGLESYQSARRSLRKHEARLLVR